MRFVRRCQFPALILFCTESGETLGMARFSQPGQHVGVGHLF